MNVAPAGAVAHLDSLETFSPESVGPCYFRRLDEDYLVTNDFGRSCLLAPKEFFRFMRGALSEGDPSYRRLLDNGFLRQSLDLERWSSAWKERHAYLGRGPGLHIVVVTLRCSLRCVYCQASPAGLDETGLDMSLETAERVLDRIFETPSPDVTIEFQGGEPLANWPVVKFIAERAAVLSRKARKRLRIGLVSNFGLMDEEKLDFLLKRRVALCTSLDGPADIHDGNRISLGGSSHADVVRWWQEIRRRTRGRARRLDGLLTTTRLTLGHPREIVDEYRRLGARGIYLRFLSPFGLAGRTWDSIGYTPDEFLAFYRTALDYVIELNLRDPQARFFEQTAKLFLQKMLCDDDPNHMDLRSPCGAAIGQLAYNHDGSVYTCDEGRMMSRMGDESFRIGHVAASGLVPMLRHPTVRTLVTASVLEGQPVCSTCAYKPFCGVCPIYNHVTQGDIFGRMKQNARCRIHQGVLDLLFLRMKDPAVRDVFQRWLASPGPQPSDKCV